MQVVAGERDSVGGTIKNARIGFVSLLFLLTVMKVGADASTDASTATMLEYWSVWTHSTAAENFDGEALAIGSMNAVAVKSAGDYFVVEHDAGGRPIEAVQVLKGKPNCRYRYYYDETGRPLLRTFEFWVAGGLKPGGEVRWSYDDAGLLISTAYFAIPGFGVEQGLKKLKYMKLHSGVGFTIVEGPSLVSARNAESTRRFESLSARLSEIDSKQGRGLFQLIFGW